MATQNFEIRTSRQAGHKQRNYFCLAGSYLASVRFELKKKSPDHLKIQRTLTELNKVLSKMDKHDQKIWGQMLNDK